MTDPFELISKSQQITVKLAADALRTIRDTTVTTVTAPEDLVRQVSALAGALTGIAGATAQPLQDFLARQREVAETMATLAAAQAELAKIVAALADRHVSTVEALERLSAPVFAVVGTQTPATSTSKPKSAKRS